MNLERAVWPCEEASNRKISFHSENTGFPVGRIIFAFQKDHSVQWFSGRGQEQKMGNQKGKSLSESRREMMVLFA